MGKRVTVFGLHDSYSSSLTGFIDILESANVVAQSMWKVDDTPFEWQLSSLDGKPIHCSNGLSIPVHSAITAPPSASVNSPFIPEILIISAPYISRMRRLSFTESPWKEPIDWLRQHHHLYSQIVTHCHGTFFLAEAGLLDNKSATTSWWLAEHFAKRYPKVNMQAEKRVIKDDRFLIGGSTSCYRDVCLMFVEQHAGVEIARTLSKYLLMDKSTLTQTAFAMPLPLKTHNPIIEKAQQWILKNIETNISVEDVAGIAAVTPRTLIRHFQKELGHSPQTHIQKMRVERGKILLETTQLNCQAIANRCGYHDEGAFRRLFKKYFDISPTEYRKMFSTV